MDVDEAEPVVIKDLTFQYTALCGLPVTRNLDLTLKVMLHELMCHNASTDVLFS